jgi:hypothetical protein
MNRNKPSRSEISRIMALMGAKGGKKGGKIGGKRRLETLSPERRREIARNAGIKSGEARRKGAKQKDQP